ncbi:unnamed protein product [Owenia fusiformis]|uniref:Uncharacterized protein n=1 Tax=Owenia fusiformis TaxID=6347 RepID=A0A8J1UEV8_OWEFU|nr:unnamed protein product [Owenia fusiformis]
MSFGRDIDFKMHKVFIGWETLDMNEQAVVYNNDGEGRVEEGPKRLFLFREKFVPLSRYTADQNHYLQVKYRNGTIEHIRGPCLIYKNPLEHDSIKLENNISLDANEVLVIYQRDETTGAVRRYLQHGPTMFIPQANEWLHKFCWHGVDPNNKTRLLPHSNTFSKLKVIPDQFYYNVDEVRTADDALIRVKLMIFYELTDIEQMLNSTQDPIADFVNCVCADVIAFSSKLTYMEFIELSGELNNLTNYPQLKARSKAIGYEISKVVFRGYYASEKLQKLHDNAIAARTKLKMAFEREEQEQLLTDMKLNADTERISTEQKMELESINHIHEMERKEQEHSLGIEMKQFQGEMSRLEQDQKATIQMKGEMNKQKVEHYTNLKTMGVDLTEFVKQQAARPQKLIHVSAENNAANLHLHQ